MRISCSVDRCDTYLVEGWILDRDAPGTRLSVDILTGDPPGERLIGTIQADRFRQDLRDAAIGDGHCAFSAETPPLAPQERIWLRLHGSDLLLRMPPHAPGRDEPAMWFDRADWLAGLRRRTNDAALASQILRFRHDGFLHLPATLPAPQRRLLCAEHDFLWRYPPDGLQMERFAPDGHQRIEPADRAWRSGADLIDPHRISNAIRATLPGALHGVIALMLGHEPDVAESRLGPLPDTMGAWQQDGVTGPPGTRLSMVLTLTETTITVLPGSQSLPPFPFGPDKSRSLAEDVTAQDAYQHTLRQHAEQFGCTATSITLAPGDALVRHPMLAHASGGNGLCLQAWLQ